MPERIRSAAIVGAIALAGWYAWGWLVPGDEAEIREVLDRIAVGASTRGGGVSLQSDLDRDITVDAGAPFERLNGREMVIETAARVKRALLNLEIRFSDVEVTVEPDRQRARTSLTAEAYFMATPGARRFDARELQVEFERLDDRWVVTEVSLIRALKPIQR